MSAADNGSMSGSRPRTNRPRADGRAGGAGRRARGGVRLRRRRRPDRRRPARARPGGVRRAPGPPGRAARATVRDLGGSREAAAAAYALPFPVPDAAAAVRLAAELEDRVAGVYSDLVRAAEGARRRRRPRTRCGRRRCGRCAGGASGVAFPGLAERAAADRPVRRRERRRRRALTTGRGAVTAHQEGNRLSRHGLSNRRSGWCRALGDDPARAGARLAGRRCPRLAAAGAGRAAELTLERVHVPGGRSSLVVLVRQADGTPAALKLARCPGRARSASGAALAHWDGWARCGCCGPADERRAAAGAAAPRGVAAVAAGGEGAAGGGGHGAAAVGASRRPGMPSRPWPSGPGGRPRRCGLPAPGRRRSRRWSTRRWRRATSCWPAPPEAAAAARHFRQGKVLAGERAPWLAVGPDPVVGECATTWRGWSGTGCEDLIASPSGAAAATRRRVKQAGGLPGRGPGAAARLDAVPGGGVRRTGAGAWAGARERSCCWSSRAGCDGGPPQRARTAGRRHTGGRPSRARSARGEAGDRLVDRQLLALAGAAVLELDDALGGAAAGDQDRRDADQLGVGELHARARRRRGRRPGPARPRRRSFSATSRASSVWSGLARGDDVDVGRGDLARASTGPARRRSARRGRRPRGRRRCRTSPW